MASFHSFLSELLVQLLLGSAAATQLSTSFAPETARTIVMSSGPPVQNVMICNAYAGEKAMDIYHLNTGTHLTSNRPLAYKECSTFKMALQDGEQFDFQTGNLSVGVFRATGVPRGPGSLLLIPHRRTPTALNAAFESHAFAELGTSQLVVLDVYGGKEAGKLKIMDVVPESAGKKNETASAPPRLEDMRFNSVVQMPPGEYKLMLEDAADTSLSSVLLHIRKENAKYVVLRMGNMPEAARANESQAFPQELVLHQQMESGAQAAARLQLLALSVVLLAGLSSRH